MNNLIFKLTITFPWRQKNGGVYNPTKTFFHSCPNYITELQNRFHTKMMRSHDIKKVEMTTEYVSYKDRQKNEKENGWIRVGYARAAAEWVIFYEMLDYGDKSSTSDFVNKCALRYSREVFCRIQMKCTKKRYWYTKFLEKRLPSSFYGLQRLYADNDIKGLRAWAQSFVDVENKKKAEGLARAQKRRAERLASVN